MAAIIGAAAAALEIRRACAASEESPFFFLVGAGIASPSIPLAAAITEDCADKYEADRQRFPALVPPSANPRIGGLEAYSYFFELAYPQAAHRAEYLAKLIKGKPISGATLRLGHLLASGVLTKLVITPNFDDHLQRALSLFGESYVVCDHPLTTARINPDRRDVIQIVHVHGTYWYYDCCNLKYELAAQAEVHGAQLSSMPMLLSQVLSKRSPIVVGYSGWEGDLIMGTLRRKLSERVPYNLYWFCYSSEAYAMLPAWLKAHQNVRFIVPSESELIEQPESTGLEKVISAQRVFDTLIQTFDLREPALTADPLGFFSRRLRAELGESTALSMARQDGLQPDLYDFGSVIERIDRAAVLEHKAVSGLEFYIEELRSAVRRSDYEAVVRTAREITTDLADMSTEHIEAYVSALEIAAPNVAEAADSIAARKAAIDACIALTQRTNAPQPRLRLWRNMLDLADVLAMDVDDPGPAKELMLEVIRDSEACSIEAGDVIRVRALTDLGGIEEIFGHYDRAAQAYDKILEVYSNKRLSPSSLRDAEVAHYVVVALRHASRVALVLNDAQRANALFEDLVAKFAIWDDPFVQRQVAIGIRDHVRELTDRGLYDDAIIAAQSVNLFTSPSPSMNGVLLAAGVHEARALLALDRAAEALALVQRVIDLRRRELPRAISTSDQVAAYEIAVSALAKMGRTAEAQGLAAEARQRWATSNFMARPALSEIERTLNL
jgi:tetratricopeptide (TPR) repeat protein